MRFVQKEKVAFFQHYQLFTDISCGGFTVDDTAFPSVLLGDCVGEAGFPHSGGCHEQQVRARFAVRLRSLDLLLQKANGFALADKAVEVWWASHFGTLG